MNLEIPVFVPRTPTDGNPGVIRNADGVEVTSHENDGRVAQLVLGISRHPCVRLKDAKVPDDCLDAAISDVHDRNYVAFIEEVSSSLPQKEVLYDQPYVAAGALAETPLYAGIFDTAREGARLAVAAAQAIVAGAPIAYALCRPPGHHAGQNFLGGYCYLNNAAIAARFLLHAGLSPLAVIDFDFHFGNGTADILVDEPSILFGSCHCSTAVTFPYFPEVQPTSTQQVFIPFSSPPSAGRFLAAIDTLLDAALSHYAQVLVISAGFDIVEGDPHGNWHLTPAVLRTVGNRLRRCGLPLCIVQEGGYRHSTLAECADHFVSGLQLINTGDDLNHENTG